MSVIYETPDGEKCAEKTIATTIVAGKIGLVVGVYDAHGGYAAKSFMPFVARVGYWTGPAILMGAAFGAGTCLSAQVRGKNDFINHAVGGMLMAGAYGIRGGPKAGWIAVPIFAGILGTMKYLKDTGAVFLPPLPNKDHGIFGNNDHSIGPGRNVKEPTQY